MDHAPDTRDVMERIMRELRVFTRRFIPAEERARFEPVLRERVVALRTTAGRS